MPVHGGWTPARARVKSLWPSQPAVWAAGGPGRRWVAVVTDDTLGTRFVAGRRIQPCLGAVPASTRRARRNRGYRSRCGSPPGLNAGIHRRGRGFRQADAQRRLTAPHAIRRWPCCLPVDRVLNALTTGEQLWVVRVRPDRVHRGGARVNAGLHVIDRHFDTPHTVIDLSALPDCRDNVPLFLLAGKPASRNAPAAGCGLRLR